MRMMLRGPWIAPNISGNRLAALLPVVILLHLGLAHADHLTLGSIDQSDAGNTGASHHISIANTDSKQPADTCPVPSATVRAEMSELDVASPAAPAEEIIELSARSASVTETSVLPKRLDGPARQALLECFRL
jgi:hypothetical protein